MKNQEEALDSFIDKVGQINERLDALQLYFSNHMNCDPDEVDWGHVGSASHALNQLDEIIEFLGIK